MKRRKRKGGRPVRAIGHGPVGRALVPVDPRPIFAKLRAKYRRAKTNLERAEREIERFERDDAPAFSAWYYSRFGQLLTDIRQIEEETRRIVGRLLEIEEVALANNLSPAGALHRIKLREAGLLPEEPEPEDGRAGADQPDDPFGAGGPDGEDPSGDGGGEAAFGEEAVFFAAAGLFEAFFGALPPGFEKARRAYEQKRARMAAPDGQKKPPPDRQIRNCYREIVRKLHPDRTGSFSALESELWHAAQAAYAARDLAGLEAVLARCDARDGEIVHIDRASVLKRMISDLNEKLRHLQNRIRSQKRDPAWGFASRREPAGLAERIRSGLDRQMKQARWDLGNASSELAKIEAQYGRWLQQRAGAASKKSRKMKQPPPPDPNQDEFAF